MGSPDPGSGRTGRRRQRSGHGACQEMVQLLGQGQRFREVTERWRSLENLCKGRMSERTSEWWQDKHAELPGGAGTGRQGRAGGVRGRHARARAGERPGLGHVPLLSLSTAGQGQRVEAAAGALAGAGRPSGARVWLRQVVTRHGPHQGAD